MSKDTTMSLRVPMELKQTLQEQAKQQNISFSNYVLGLLQSNFNNHPCQASQHRICLIETYNAIEQGNTHHALKLLRKELEKNESKK